MKLKTKSPRVKAALRELYQAIAELNFDSNMQGLPADVVSLQLELKDMHIANNDLRKQLELQGINSTHLRETVNRLESELAAERKRVAAALQDHTATADFNLTKADLEKLNENHVGETKMLRPTEDDIIETNVTFRSAYLRISGLVRHIKAEVERIDEVTLFAYDLHSSIAEAAQSIQRQMDALEENHKRWENRFGAKRKP